MVLWDDTRIVPCDNQLWALPQYSEHGVATGTIKFATRAGKTVWTADKCYVYAAKGHCSLTKFPVM